MQRPVQRAARWQPIVTGCTCVYAYRDLNSWLKFPAGWLFPIAKPASAATAALGFAGYLRSLAEASATLQVPVALAHRGIDAHAGKRSSSAVGILTASLRRSALSRRMIVQRIHGSAVLRHHQPRGAAYSGDGALCSPRRRHRQPYQLRRPRWFVELHFWLLGLSIILAGLVWHWLARRRSNA